MTEFVLAANNLGKIYRVRSGWFGQSRQLTALDQVSFQLKQGETLAVVGESGSGKSTLARQLVGIEKANSGKIYIDGVDVYSQSKSAKKAFQQVRIIFQNPYASLNPRARIASILEEPLRNNTKLDATARQEKVAQNLAKVGLRPEHARRFPHMFSGGQRQRIAIARALMLQPKVIIADEPISALDVSVQAQVVNLMLDLQEELGLSYVFISHNLGIVQSISDHILVLYLGQVMEFGTVADIFDNPQHPYTRTLLTSTPAIKRNYIAIKKNCGEPPSPFDPPKGCPFANRCPYVEDVCHQHSPFPRKYHNQLISCHKAGDITL